jgi:hypothetical protein
MIRSIRDVPVHLVREAEPYLDSLIRELFHNRGDIACNLIIDLVEWNGRHDGGLKDGTRGDYIVQDSRQLASIKGI